MAADAGHDGDEDDSDSDSDDIDIAADAARPQVRTFRIVVSTGFLAVGATFALLAWFAIHPSRPPHEPQGSPAVIGQSLVTVVGWATLVASSAIALIAAVSLALALIEARAARGARST